MDRTDAELLIASRDDAQAFRELYDRWAERLLAYFYRRVLDAEVAGERVQQLLDDAGWTGWRTTVRSDLGDGPCGTVTAMGGDGRRYLEGSLDPREKRVLILPEER